MPIPSDVRMAGWLEQAWLERYLARALDDDETEWFDMYVLDKPSLLAAIDADSDLRDGLHMADSSNVRVAALPVARRRRSGPALAWAASALLGVGVGWIAASQISPDMPVPALVASPTRIVYDTLRGVDDAPTVYPGATDSAWVLVEIGVPVDAEAVQLHASGEPLRELVVSAEGFASFLAPRQWLDDSGEISVTYRAGGQENVRRIGPFDDSTRAR